MMDNISDSTVWPLSVIAVDLNDDVVGYMFC